ncbi:MAG: glycosyltransferase family 4 protein [Promethearchaeota archaeon]
MRILFLLEHMRYTRMGGSEIQAYYLIEELKKTTSHEIHYAFNSNIDPKINDNKISYYCLHDYGKAAWINLLPLRRLIKKVNPDIIYQRCRFGYTGIAANYAKNKSMKMVFHVASDRDCKKNQFLSIKGFPGIITEYMGRYGIKNVDLIIAQSRYQQKLIKQNFNLSSIFIPNGHPVPPLPFKKGNPPIVAWIANIKLWKQPEVFIKLARELQDTDARFVYAGRPSTISKGKYQNMLISETKKLDNLTYLGEIPFEKTNELLARSSIFINTSLPREGFPNTYIQAWMRETPVVALLADPDGLNKEHQIGFHSCSFEQLVKDVRYLIENEDERKAMGSRARKYADENHDIKKIGERYVEALEELVK